MITLLRAFQRLSLLVLIASPFLSPAAADAITGVEMSGRSEERSLIVLPEDLSTVSAFILAKPGTSSALGFGAGNCDTNANVELAMVQLDLKSPLQMWKYDTSTSSIQSIACPDKVITIISSSSCELVEVSDQVAAAENSQKFTFVSVPTLSDDETAGVRIKSSASGCGNKLLSDGGDDGSVGDTSSITMRGKIFQVLIRTTPRSQI